MSSLNISQSIQTKKNGSHRLSCADQFDVRMTFITKLVSEIVNVSHSGLVCLEILHEVVKFFLQDFNMFQVSSQFLWSGNRFLKYLKHLHINIKKKTILFKLQEKYSHVPTGLPETLQNKNTECYYCTTLLDWEMMNTSLMNLEWHAGSQRT